MLPKLHASHGGATINWWGSVIFELQVYFRCPLQFESQLFVIRIFCDGNGFAFQAYIPSESSKNRDSHMIIHPTFLLILYAWCFFNDNVSSDCIIQTRKKPSRYNSPYGWLRWLELPYKVFFFFGYNFIHDCLTIYDQFSVT